MPATFVQSWEDLTTSTASTKTLLVVGASPGNLLIGQSILRTPGSEVTTPPGWTRLGTTEGLSGATHLIEWCYRYASGDTNDNYEMINTATSRFHISVAEYSGLPSSAAPEAVSTINWDKDTDNILTLGKLTQNGGAVFYLLGAYSYERWQATNGQVTITNNVAEPIGVWDPVGRAAGSTGRPSGYTGHGTYGAVAFSRQYTFTTSYGVDTATYSALAAFFADGGVTPLVKEMYTESGGSWAQSTPYLHVGGAWQEVEAHVRAGGSWVKVHDKG